MFAELASDLPDALPEPLGFSMRLEHRLEIVAMNRHGFSKQQIAWLSGCDARTVECWISRFGEDGRLADRPRSGRPPQISEAVRLRAIGFYCQASPLPGCGSWTLSWAATYLKDHGNVLGQSISRSSLHRILRSQSLKPHLYKYFLQIKDPDFFPKMERVIALYLRKPEYLFLFDECPNLQALKRKDPPLNATEGTPNYEGHDYTRHGTVDLMAFLQPSTGDVFGRCTFNHNTETLISVFKEHVLTQPEDVQLDYLMDNLSPHYHNNFCEMVAELSQVKYEPLKTAVERREWLQTPDKRIVVHFTPFHGSWLNMVEIWFGIFQQKCIYHVDFHSVDELIEAIYDFIRTWNLYFKHPFNWTYTGHGLHEKAVRRFIRLLSIESPHIEPAFLGNQCCLMHNLITNYHRHVPEKDWLHLRETWLEKQKFVERIIENDPGPRRQKKVRSGFDKFNLTLAALN